MKFYVDTQPMDKDIPMSPFSGFFLNIGVATHAHRDPNDHGPCAVFCLGQFTGGELVLHDLGLVVDLRPGEVIFFPSRDVTHYNLHFEGVRSSIVLTFDKDGLRWVKRNNGWHAHLQQSSRDNKRKKSLDVESEDGE